MQAEHGNSTPTFQKSTSLSCLIFRLRWNTGIETPTGDLLPVNGTAKTITLTKTVNKKSESNSTTFLTVSTCECERDFFGLNAHAAETPAKGETISVTASGNSGLLMVVSGQNKKKSLINFGRNRFESIDCASVSTKGTPDHADGSL